MSKSRGNVVIPDEYIAQWGADTFRLYLMFLGPFQEGGDFRDAGINGPRRFLDRVWLMVGDGTTGGEIPKELVTRWHATRKKAAEDLESLHYNTAISALMELVNAIRESGCRDRAVDSGSGRDAGTVRASLCRGVLGAAGTHDDGV